MATLLRVFALALIEYVINYYIHYIQYPSLSAQGHRDYRCG